MPASGVVNSSPPNHSQKNKAIASLIGQFFPKGTLLLRKNLQEYIALKSSWDFKYTEQDWKFMKLPRTK